MGVLVGIPITWDGKYIDTLHLSQYLLPDKKSHSLGNLAKYWNIINSQAHRAFSDVNTMIKIWNVLIHIWTSKPSSVGYDESGEGLVNVEDIYRFLTLFKNKS